MMCALRDLAEQDAGPRPLRLRARRGVRGHRHALDRRRRARRLHAATSRSPASRPTCTSASRPRACSRSACTSTAAPPHGSTPWLGDNAVLKAIDVFRRIESLPFSRESSELFDRPSVNLGRIQGGDALNKVPDLCTDGRRHPLPARTRTPATSSSRSARSPTSRSSRTFTRVPAYVSRANPYVVGARRRRRPAHPGRVDERRPRRRLRRGLVPRRPGSRRSSSGPRAPATTGPRSGCRSPRSRATARRCATSSPSCPARWPRRAPALRAVEGGLA